MHPRVRIRVEIDREGLIDDYLAYLTDPRPSRNEHHAAVLDGGPVPAAVLEQMVLDGVDSRADVAGLVTYLLERMNEGSAISELRWV